MSEHVNIPKNIFKYAWRIMRGYRIAFFFNALVVLCGSLYVGVVFPLLVKNLTTAAENFSGSKENFMDEVGIYIILLVGARILSYMFFWVTFFLRRWYYPRMQINSDYLMFCHIQNHSFNYFASRFSGGLSAKIRDISMSIESGTNFVTWIASPVLTFFVLAVTLVTKIQPMVATVLGVWMTVTIGLIVFSIKGWNRVNRDYAEVRAKVTGKITDAIANILSVKIFTAQHIESRALRENQITELAAEIKTRNASGYLMIKRDILDALFYVALAYYLITSFMNDTISLGDVLFVIMVKRSIEEYLQSFMWRMPAFMRAVGMGQQALDTLTEVIEIKDIDGAKELKYENGEINFNGIHFAYKDDKIFDGFDLKIAGGEKLGIVGLSGAGKTTLVNLLLRLFDVSGGRIEIDGQDISKVKQNSLRGHISFVAQETSLFHRSLSENIAYGLEDASEEKIVEAAKLAHAHDFITETINGYQTEVGERGIKLSGGQRQRIAIARAFLKNAPIFILDEATSALDTETERAIQDSLEHLIEGRTTLAIAHRLSTLRQMDRIIVLEEGRIVEEGTHDELLEKSGLYGKLWQMQSDGFIPDNL